MNFSVLRPGYVLSLLVAGVAAVAAAGALPTTSTAAVTIGIGQQTPEIFSHPKWRALDVRHVRYIAPWDTLSDPYQLALLDTWMQAADAAGGRVMIGFRTSMRSPELARVLPTRKQFARQFRGFIERYPKVRDWVPWNEPNHRSALTGRKPRLVAAYFNIATRQCRAARRRAAAPGRRCNIVAGDVLDTTNMASWVRRYRRHLRTRPRIWGMHNYNDANSFRSRNVRRLLKLVRGRIWLTETGGLVRMRVDTGDKVLKRNHGVRRAARSTRHVLNLARISRRIRRIYLYHWRAPKTFTTWDSALVGPDPRFRPRPAYRVLRRWLRRARRTGLAKAGRCTRRHPCHYRNRGMLTADERRMMRILLRKRRVARRGGGWQRVDPSHLRAAVEAKHGLRERRRALRRLAVTSTRHRAARYKILGRIIRR